MPYTRRQFILYTAATGLLHCSPALGSGLIELRGAAFGAHWRALVPPDIDSHATMRVLQGVIDWVDAEMSPYRPHSALSRFNASNRTGWYSIAPKFRAVVAHAKLAACYTNGCFDPTVGALVGKFGFGPIVRQFDGNHNDLEVSDRAIRKAVPNLTLDLCGLAKGFAADQMATALDRRGVRFFLVEVGGEVVVRGMHPSGRPWRVGIENPEMAGLSVRAVMLQSNEAMATSGSTVNSYRLAGKEYSHIIDPNGKEPASSSLRSVSVVAGTAMEADALATALFAMGDEAGVRFAAREVFAACISCRASMACRST